MSVQNTPHTNLSFIEVSYNPPAPRDINISNRKAASPGQCTT